MKVYYLQLTVKKISINEVYYKINSEDNSKVPVLKNVAMAESQLIEKARYDDFKKRINGGYENDDIDLCKANTETYDYIRIYHRVSHLGSGKYEFSTDSRWLTMPKIRSYDSLGSCAQDISVTSNSRIGSYTYTMKTILDGEEETKIISSKSLEKSELADNGSWYGAAGVFRLPASAYDGEGSSIVCSDFSAHYEFQGNLKTPSVIPQNFNSKGVYAHSTISLTIAPSISVSGGEYGIGIDIDLAKNVEHYICLVEEKYNG